MGFNRCRQQLGRLANNFGSDGASLMVGKTINAAKRIPLVSTSEIVVAAIADRWEGTDKELAEAARISPSSMSALKTENLEKVTPSLRKLCRVLRIDPFKLVKTGRIVEIARESSRARQDLHDLLDRIVGTANEAAMEKVLRAFADAERH